MVMCIKLWPGSYCKPYFIPEHFIFAIFTKIYSFANKKCREYTCILYIQSCIETILSGKIKRSVPIKGIVKLKRDEQKTV